MKRIDTLQNLILIALADGQVTEAEKNTVHGYADQMGISNKELDELLGNIDQLDFIIPESQEEKINELYKLTMLSLTDNRLADQEFKELLSFAETCGLTEDQLNSIINTASDQHDQQEKIVVMANQVQYDAVLETVRQSGKKDAEIAGLLQQCTQSRDLNMIFSDKAAINEAFYKLLWLMYCRYASLNEGGIVMLAMQTESAKSGNYSLDDMIYDFKLTEEGYFDGKNLLLSDMTTEQIKKEIRDVFPFKG